MKSIEEMTKAELRAFVQTHLRHRSIEVVLSRGVAVAIYGLGKQVSKDPDMVRTYAVGRGLSMPRWPRGNLNSS